MKEILKKFGDRLEGTEPYSPGKAPSGGVSGRLASNEASLGASPQVRAAVAQSVFELHRYPDQSLARRSVADMLGVDVNRIVLTNGSDELCYLIANLAIDHGTRVVLSDPCYRIDEIVSRLNRALVIKVPVLNGAHDLVSIAREATSGSVVWLPSPHNPTGRVSDKTEIARFLKHVPDNVLVVLDEAYRAYVDPLLAPDALHLLDKHPNLIVQRTMSKDHALAGLRVGYAICSKELAAALNIIRPPFGVSAPAQGAIQAAVADESWRNYAVALVRRERQRFETFLCANGFEFFPSQANFVTVKVPERAIGVILDRVGISVRAGEDLGMPGWTRVTIGTPVQMSEVRAAFAELAKVH